MFALRRTVVATRFAHVRSLHASGMSLAEKSALETRLRDGLKSAMKAKDKAGVTVLKAIIADVTNAAKSGPDPSEPASQEAVITAIRKGIDKRSVAAESYAPNTPGAHPELHAQLAAEIALLQGYMPVAPTGEAVQALVDEIVGGLPADKRGKAATGQIMKALWERLGDARAAVDKKDVARRVGEALK